MIPLASINGHQWLVEEKKKIPLPDYMLRRFPPHRRQELQAVSSDSESSDSDQPLDIPEKASVKFAVHDGYPGLQVRTRVTSNWTPIASRTRAKAILIAGCMLVLAYGYSCHPLYGISVQELS